MPVLDGQTVVVVGGGSHLGRAIAIAAAAEGATVVVAGPTEANVRATAEEIGGSARPMVTDIADEASIAALADAVGSVDHVVCTAAMHANGKLAQVDAAAATRAYAAKAVGPLMLAKHLAPRMNAGGSFTFLSGIMGRRFARGLAVMGATNAAIIGVAQALAVEIAPLRVNTIAPGMVDSGVYDGMSPAGRSAMFAGTARRYPVQRIGEPRDVVEAVMFAMTQSFLTGAVIDVDGGGRLV
ncbi:SDR family oxidoreductase [Demequina sp.]|uniref:SDR family oxidoreductase n=1 Tax=Demequina sp. TaxID=2050685 RepID=UPI0025D6AF22|nr:SDR family oxidoreductase [Demequina sp.]